MSTEYNSIAKNVSKTFEKELFKHEQLAVEEAIRIAKNHGLEESAAKLFVNEILAKKRRHLREQINWTQV